MEKDTVYFGHPFLPLYLMAIPLSFSSSLFWGRLLGSVLGIFIVLATYFIGKNLGSSTTGLLASFFLSIHHHFLTYVHSLYIEVYLGFFVILSIVFFLLAEKKKKSIFYLLAGVTLGLALLTKYLGVALAFSYFVFFLIKKGQKVLRARELYLILIPAGIIFSFWPTFGYLTDWSGFLNEIYFWLTFGKGNLHDPRVNVSLIKYVLALGLALAPVFTIGSFFAFVSQGIRYFKKRLVDFQVFLLIFIFIWFLMLFQISVKDARHLFPILPLLSIVVAISIGTLRLTIKGLIFSLTCLTLFIPYDFLNLRKTSLNNRLYFSLFMWRTERENESCLRFGEFVRSVVKEGEVILYDRDDATAGFCAQRPYCSFVISRYEEAMEMLEEANYVVVGQEPFLPYLSEEDKSKFMAKLGDEFSLTEPWRLYVRKRREAG